MLSPFCKMPGGFSEGPPAIWICTLNTTMLTGFKVETRVILED